ncbi:MAG: GNAT family N-acetyltransferase [Oscillospiraceae bacterium]|nr:GNAT family N-acetyltransferase [Oscillospiraceae bacterium]
MIIIRRIGAENPGDARLPNEPFRLWARVIPALEDGAWSYRLERFAEAREDCFPDEPYDPEADNAIFLGAYEGESCVGLAVLRRDLFRYLLLDDLKVSAAFRGQGIGKALIEACMKEAGRLGLFGLKVVAQDNNASACLFYLGCGFSIGGFDNRSYGGSSQAGKADIFFYRDL